MQLSESQKGEEFEVSRQNIRARTEIVESLNEATHFTLQMILYKKNRLAHRRSLHRCTFAAARSPCRTDGEDPLFLILLSVVYLHAGGVLFSLLMVL